MLVGRVRGNIVGEVRSYVDVVTHRSNYGLETHRKRLRC
jgi:hypothetical protein